MLSFVYERQQLALTSFMRSTTTIYTHRENNAKSSHVRTHACKRFLFILYERNSLGFTVKNINNYLRDIVYKESLQFISFCLKGK